MHFLYPYSPQMTMRKRGWEQRCYLKLLWYLSRSLSYTSFTFEDVANPFVDAFIHEESDSVHCLSVPVGTETWKQTTEWHQYSIWPRSCIFDELFLALSNKKSKVFNSRIRLHAGVVRALNRSMPRVPVTLFDAGVISFDIQQRG